LTASGALRDNVTNRRNRKHFGRHVSRRRRPRGHYSLKRFVISTLFTTAVGVQLVIIVRYTISTNFYVNKVSPFRDKTIPASCGVLQTTIDDDRRQRASLFCRPYAMCRRTSNNSFDFVQTRLNLTDYDATETAFRMVGHRMCFVEGVDKTDGKPATEGGCPCKTAWFGRACSVPGFISRSRTPWSKDSLQVRLRPRRIVNAFPFNVEFDMLELRFAELAEVVDVFLILESNYTAYGTPKPLRLLERLCNGTYPNVIQKVVYVVLDCFPSEAYRDGWVADALVRNYLGTHGLRRVGGLQPDDLLVLNDADELPRRELISFLKWHDGFSEPVTITYRWSVFGFFWGVPASDGAMQTQQLPSVITVGMVIYVFRYRIYEIRSAARFLSQRQQAFDGQVPVVAFCTDFS